MDQMPPRSQGMPTMLLAAALALRVTREMMRSMSLVDGGGDAR